MKKRILQYAFLGVALIAVFSSCRKQSFGGEEKPDAGKTFVWITNQSGATGVNNQFFDVFTDIKEVSMFALRRDAANNADLKKAVTITLTDVSIADINAKNGTDYTLLPKEIYTLVPEAGVSQTATGLSINLASGDFAKQIKYAIDGSKVDLSKQYAVAYAITNFGGFSKKAGTDTILATIAIKNRWDGVYTATGTMSDIANGGLTHFNDFLGGDGPEQIQLRTISATQNVVWDVYWDGPVVAINSGGSASYYGSVGRVITFDPATNKITSMINYYGQPAGNTRSLQLNPAGVNAYDPGTKTIAIKYQMLQPSVVTTPPYIRTNWEETWTYVGSR